VIFCSLIGQGLYSYGYASTDTYFNKIKKNDSTILLDTGHFYQGTRSVFSILKTNTYKNTKYCVLQDCALIKTYLKFDTDNCWTFVGYNIAYTCPCQILLSNIKI